VNPTVLQSLMYLFVFAGGAALRHALGGLLNKTPAPTPVASSTSPPRPATAPPVAQPSTGGAGLGAIILQKLEARAETIGHGLLNDLVSQVFGSSASVPGVPAPAASTTPSKT
jgi:hypothetical protein